MNSSKTLGQRVAIAIGGGLVALTMILLGLWQMQVFESQGNKDAARRSTAEPVELVPLIPREGQVGDVYGRNVKVRGTYRADETVTAATGQENPRVVTALILADGRAVPVVRGVHGVGIQQAPPAGEVEVTGVFLPSEAAASQSVGGEKGMGSVRLPELQQKWSEQLSPGFVTLNASEARAQGLDPAPVTLPTQDGRVRNFGYALQWWVFAAFAVVMSVVWIRTLRSRELRALDADLTA